MTTKARHLIHCGLFLLLLILWGCIESSLDLQIRFDDTTGLQQTDPVYFEGNEIGRVGEISYTNQGDYLVDIAIEPEFINAATVDSKFHIGPNPADSESKAIIIVQEVAGGQVLEENSIVQGTERTGYLDQILGQLEIRTGEAENELRRALEELQKTLGEASRQLDSELERSLGELSRQFNDFKQDLQKVPDSQEVQELEESIKQFVRRFKDAGKDVQDHIRREVLPQLRHELDKLREKLEKEDRQKEMKEIEKQMDEAVMV